MLVSKHVPVQEALKLRWHKDTYKSCYADSKMLLQQTGQELSTSGLDKPHRKKPTALPSLTMTNTSWRPELNTAHPLHTSTMICPVKSTQKTLRGVTVVSTNSSLAAASADSDHIWDWSFILKSNKNCRASCNSACPLFLLLSVNKNKTLVSTFRHSHTVNKCHHYIWKKSYFSGSQLASSSDRKAKLICS